jgi:hypothetical protein
MDLKDKALRGFVEYVKRGKNKYHKRMIANNIISRLEEVVESPPRGCPRFTEQDIIAIEKEFNAIIGRG